MIKSGDKRQKGHRTSCSTRWISPETTIFESFNWLIYIIWTLQILWGRHQNILTQTREEKEHHSQKFILKIEKSGNFRFPQIPGLEANASVGATRFEYFSIALKRLYWLWFSALPVLNFLSPINFFVHKQRTYSVLMMFFV